MKSILNELPPRLQAVIRKVAELSEESEKATVKRFFRILDLLLVENKLELGPEWSISNKVVQDEFQLANRLSNVKKVPLELLEKGKSRAGFVGVYFSQGKFTSVVPDPSRGGVQKHLGYHVDALDAAVERYCWYEENGIPYGNLGKHVAHWRKLRPNLSMEEVFAIILDGAKDGSTPDGQSWPYTLNEAIQLRSRWLEKNPQLVVKKAQSAKEIFRAKTSAEIPTEKPENFVVPCASCNQPIEKAEEMTFWGQDEWKHRSCSDPVKGEVSGATNSR